MVCSVAKDVAPVLTVTVEVPAASAMEAGSTAIDSVGASSSSVMVTVADPMAVAPLAGGDDDRLVRLVDGVLHRGHRGRHGGCSGGQRQRGVAEGVVAGLGRRAAQGQADGLVGGEGVAPVLTVTVEVPAASAMEAGSTATESVGASSLSAIDTVAVSPVGEG